MKVRGECLVRDRGNGGHLRLVVVLRKMQVSPDLVDVSLVMSTTVAHPRLWLRAPTEVANMRVVRVDLGVVMMEQWRLDRRGLILCSVGCPPQFVGKGRITVGCEAGVFLE